MAVLLLAYNLAPEARYPTQLREAAAVLSHLIKEGRPPSRIIVAGDSAGGGLSLSLLSHLLHPHPEVQEIMLYEPLAGALLISPWVSFSTEDSSMTRNFYTDYLHPAMLRKWAAMFLDESTDDPEADQPRVHGDSWAEPLSNMATWWSGLHRVVGHILVWSGADEILVDSIRAFEPLLKKGWREGVGEEDRVVFVETKGRAHIEPIMSIMLEPKKKGEHQVVLEEWLQARLEQ
jgi:acetyl esterase/lipase